jgi:hypothetical protein
MKEFTGNPDFPIWLIGDSPPEARAGKLDTPLDPRHPARHSIWTSVADPMQNRLYRQRRLRLDTSRLYIRNASDKPLKEPIDGEQIRSMQEKLKGLLDTYRPTLVLTFGVNAFMITQLACGEDVSFKAATTELLGIQFRARIERWDDNGVNIVPLLHASIARRMFLQAHKYFVGATEKTPPNYFDYVGEKLADLLLEKLFDKPIWIEWLAGD